MDSEEYDSLLQRVAKDSTSNFATEADENSIEMKFVVYECGSLKITTSDGKELVNVVAKKNPNQNESHFDEEEEEPEDFGFEDTLVIDTNEWLEFKVGHPDDVSIWFDGETIILEDYLVVGEDFARFTRLNGIATSATSGNVVESSLTRDDPNQIKLKVILGEYATVRVTNTNDDLILYLDSGKVGRSEIYSIASQNKKACFEIANTSEVSIDIGNTSLDFSPFQDGNTAYFELDLNTMEFSS